MKVRSLFLTASGCAFISTFSNAQTCTYAEIRQEISMGDTFNSSGAPLDAPYAVFQQDRYYVNEQNRMDLNDTPDPVMVNRVARENYGQALNSYLSANGMNYIQVQELIGRQYVFEIEACGSRDNPSIQIVSMRIEGIGQNDSAEIDDREAELNAWDQRLDQREFELNQREQKLIEWERRLYDLQYGVAQSDIDNQSQEFANNEGVGQQSGLPLKVEVPSPESGRTEMSLPNCWGYVWMVFKMKNDAEGDAIVEHLDFNELVVQRQWITDSERSHEEWNAGRDGGGLIAINHLENAFITNKETMESCVNLMASFMEYTSLN